MKNPGKPKKPNIFGEPEPEQEQMQLQEPPTKKVRHMGSLTIWEGTYRQYLEYWAKQLRPTIDDFEVPGVYDSHDINYDQRLVEQKKAIWAKEEQDFQKRQEKKAREEERFYEYIPERKRPSRRMELLMMDLMGRGWFYEEELYGRDQFLPLYTTPTMEPDDFFGHVDLVCTFGNKYTGTKTGAETDAKPDRFRVVPFGVDVTCKDDEREISEKLRCLHVYGRKPDAPQNVSEFTLDDDQRLGTKTFGLTSVKYFIDKNEEAGYNEATDQMNIEGMRLPIGRIEMMPKLVLGASSTLADDLLNGAPDDDFREKYGDREYERAYRRYQTANKKLQWCVLLEGDAQARSILTKLMDYKARNNVKSPKLEQAIAQTKALALYFGLALKKANDVADTDIDELKEDDPDKKGRQIAVIDVEQEARNYAQNKDQVCRTILRQTEQTYFNR